MIHLVHNTVVINYIHANTKKHLSWRNGLPEGYGSTCISVSKDNNYSNGLIMAYH